MTGAPTERVFRVSWGWRLALGSGSLGLIGVLVFGTREMYNDPTAVASQRTTVVVLLAAFVLLGAFLLTFAFRGALALGDRGVRFRSLFSWREHDWKDLAGFRVPPKESRALCILVGKDGRRKLTVPQGFERPAEILAELARRLPDLDLADARKEEAAFQSERQFESRLGRTPADLATVRRLCQAANVAAFVLLVAGFLVRRFGSPGTAVFVVASLLPAPFAIFLKRRFGDAVSFDTKRGSQRASLEYALVAGLLAPIPAAIFGFPPMAPVRLFVLGLFPATLVALALFSVLPSLFSRRALAALMLIFCSVYGYGAAASVNGGLDSSPAVFRAARVVRLEPQRYSNDVVVSPFEGASSEESVSVDRSTFERLSPGDAVQVAVRRGALGAPWIAGLKRQAAATPAAP